MSYKSNRFFNLENPPKSGKVKKLWDWFIKEFKVDQGEECNITINRPGHWQRAAGTPDYCIGYRGKNYVCYTEDIEEIIKNTANDYLNEDHNFDYNHTGIIYL